MKKLALLCGVLLVTLSLAAPSVACHEEPPELREVSIDEASDILEMPVPVPTYLPEGYEIQRVYMKGTTVILLISDEELGAKQQWKLRIEINWINKGAFEPMKLPYQRVEIDDGIAGFIVERETTIDLWWQWPRPPEWLGWFEFTISAIKEIPKEEIVKAARGMGGY